MSVAVAPLVSIRMDRRRRHQGLTDESQVATNTQRSQPFYRCIAELLVMLWWKDTPGSARDQNARSHLIHH